MAKKRLKHFEKRSIQDAARRTNLTEDFINREIKKYYELAENEIQEEIEWLYEKFASEENINLLEAKKQILAIDLKKVDLEALSKQAIITNDSDLLKFIKTVSAKTRITRLDILNLEIQKTLSELFNKEQTSLYNHLLDTYKDSYFRGVYNTQQLFQIGYDFVKPSEQVIKTAITNKWENANYSQRLWGHREKLSKELQEHITTGLIQGKSVNEMAKKIARDMEISLNNAKRLVRTETNYIHNQATLDVYKNYAGIEQYKYLATLDFKTSAICQELDGKIFKVDEAKAGVNFPPMHPNCRSTTTVYFEDDPIGERIATDANGNTYYVPEDLTYEQWFNNLSEDEKGKMSLNLKKHQNLNQDEKQFERYKNILGKDAPKTIEEFQNIKYNNKDKWESLKQKYKNEIPKIQDGFKNYTNPRSIPKVYKDYVNSLSEEDKNILQRYTGFLSRNVNVALRKQIFTDTIKSEIDHIDKIVNNSILPENVILKRGTIIQMFEGFEKIKNIQEIDISNLEGKILTDNAFCSTGIINAQEQSREVIMNIYAPKGFKGAVYLEPVAYDKYKNQYEVLLRRGCNYEVLDAIMKKNKLYLEVRLLDD